MNRTNYDKLQLAKIQLEAACVCYSDANKLFKDYISAITLAGAAGTIFYQYLRLKQKNSITKKVANIFTQAESTGITLNKVRSALNKDLTNSFKHRKETDPLFLETNLKEKARFGILATMIDYKEIFRGNSDLFLHEFAEGLAKEFLTEGDKKILPKKITYKNIAIKQLKQAIRLFLEKRYIAAITLAGAADNILISLLETKGKKCFATIIKQHDKNELDVGIIRKELNDTLNINAIKHLDSLDDRYIKMNPKECAFTAIFKSLVNYKNLAPHLYKKDEEVIAFLRWAKKNLDPKIYHINKI